jgi:hypothetical protein
MPCPNLCRLFLSLRVFNSLCKFIQVLPSLILVTLQNIFGKFSMPEDAPQPDESKSAFRKSFALCAMGSANRLWSIAANTGLHLYGQPAGQQGSKDTRTASYSRVGQL